VAPSRHAWSSCVQFVCVETTRDDAVGEPRADEVERRQQFRRMDVAVEQRALQTVGQQPPEGRYSLRVGSLPRGMTTPIYLSIYFCYAGTC
jgi:hypothetical protein